MPQWKYGTCALLVAVIATCAYIAMMPGEDGVPWQLKVASGTLSMVRKACGMDKPDGVSIFGRPWRVCLESAVPKSPTGEWGGVRSTDVAIPRGSGGTMRARVYTPTLAEESGTPLPLVVYYHGGGWTIGHYDDRHVDDLARAWAQAGMWVVVSVEYALAPEDPFPAAVVDAYAAAAWAATSKHPALAYADPNQLVLAGDSAGGNLAAVVAHLARDGKDGHNKSAPRFHVAHTLLVYPAMLPPDDTPSKDHYRDAYILPKPFMDFFVASYLGADVDDQQRLERTDARASPLALPSFEGLPPATIVHAQHDPLRDEGAMYAERLRKAGVAPVEELDYNGMVHGFFAMLLLNVPDTLVAISDTARVVNDALASSAPQK